MPKKKDKPENVESDDVVVKHDPEVVKKRTAELVKMDTRPVQPSGFTREEVGWIAVFLLIFFGSLFTPTEILEQYQVGILVFVGLPLLAWFTRLIYLDEKRRSR